MGISAGIVEKKGGGGGGGKGKDPELSQKDIDDGWGMTVKKKKKTGGGGAKPQAGAADSGSASAGVRVAVEARKVGLIIGPGGATVKGLMERSGATIDLPQNRDRDSNEPATISISGPPAATAAAKKAIEELCAKGYCALMSGPDFGEGGVLVHPQYFSDIIGPVRHPITATAPVTRSTELLQLTAPAPGPPHCRADGRSTQSKLRLAPPSPSRATPPPAPCAAAAARG